MLWETTVESAFVCFSVSIIDLPALVVAVLPSCSERVERTRDGSFLSVCIRTGTFGFGIPGSIGYRLLAFVFIFSSGQFTAAGALAKSVTPTAYPCIVRDSSGDEGFFPGDQNF